MPGKVTTEYIAWDDEFRGRKRMQLDNLNDRDAIHKGDYNNFGTDGIKRRAVNGNLRFVNRTEGNLISSMVAPDLHLPALDLDGDHLYVPSSSKGHGHLYLTNLMTTAQYRTFLGVLHAYGIIEQGIIRQMEAHGMTTVRQPHVKKSWEKKEIF